MAFEVVSWPPRSHETTAQSGTERRSDDNMGNRRASSEAELYRQNRLVAEYT